MDKIVVISVHPLFDNRIAKHLRTLLKYHYDVTYLNSSDSEMENYSVRVYFHSKRNYIRFFREDFFKKCGCPYRFVILNSKIGEYYEMSRYEKGAIK